MPLKEGGKMKLKQVIEHPVEALELIALRRYVIRGDSEKVNKIFSLFHPVDIKKATDE